MDVNDNHKSYLEKILKSKHFSSQTESKLLRFLFEATKSKKELKETIIAIDVFGRDDTFNPGEDSVVRSSIYNLRKKLDVYYLDEGKYDPVKLSIPKGQYFVSFQKNRPTTENKTDRKKNNKLSSILALVFFIAFIICFVFVFKDMKYMNNLRSIKKDNYVWKEILESDRTLSVVLGDYFMLENIQQDDSTSMFIRDVQINSQEQFITQLKQNPELTNQVRAYGVSYFSEEIPWCLNEISRIFKGYQKNIVVKNSSEISYHEVKENDIIFIGDFTSLGKLNLFLENTHYRFTKPNKLLYLSSPADTMEVITLQQPVNSSFQNDYALIAKTIGIEGQTMILILSFTPFGKAEAMYKLTDNTFIENLIFESEPLPVEWDMLLKISGVESSGFSYELVRFESL